MAMLPPDQRGSWQDFLVFVLKALGLLAGIFVFGLVVFWLRRSAVVTH